MDPQNRSKGVAGTAARRRAKISPHLKRRVPWRSRLLDWLGGAFVATVIGIPVAQFYYERSARESEQEMRELRAVIVDAVSKGVVEAQYNAHGQLMSLQKPRSPQGFRVR